jgi:hypothetical protein
VDGWVGGWVAGQVRLYNYTFGHPIGWVFPLGRVWQYPEKKKNIKLFLLSHNDINLNVFSKLPYTDFLTAEGGVDGASGLLELLPDEDPPDADIQYDDDDDDIQAVQSEADNYLIDQRHL